jgi:hypothetical protein
MAAAGLAGCQDAALGTQQMMSYQRTLLEPAITFTLQRQRMHRPEPATMHSQTRHPLTCHQKVLQSQAGTKSSLAFGVQGSTGQHRAAQGSRSAGQHRAAQGSTGQQECRAAQGSTGQQPAARRQGHITAAHLQRRPASAPAPPPQRPHCRRGAQQWPARCWGCHPLQRCPPVRGWQRCCRQQV